MAYIAEIFTDHPTRTMHDQVDDLYVAKRITASDYLAVCQAIAEGQAALDDPRTDHLAVLLKNGEQVKVTKFVPAQGYGAGARVRIAKREYASAREEIEEKCKAYMQTGMSRDDAQRRVAADDSGLMARYRHEMLFGGLSNAGVQGPPVDTEPLSKADVMQMAKTMVAKDAGTTLRDALATLVQQHPRESVFLNTYRDYHHGQGLDEHHGGTAPAPRLRSAYDLMSSGHHS
jgi:hypothetical protein